MANWCSNTVAFEGNETPLEQIKSKFRRMINIERTEQYGQLPDFVNPKDSGYFFDIIWDEGDCIFSYQTKWTQNTKVLVQIAERFNVDFIHDYEEVGNLVYGRSIYEDSILTEIDLDGEDFEKYQYDDETGIYYLEREAYDSDAEILETLLERKVRSRNENAQLLQIAMQFD